jgi:hypothetical protein
MMPDTFSRQIYVHNKMARYLLLARYLLFFLVSLTTATYALAQDRIALKLSPGLCYGRVHTNPDTAYYASQGAAFRGKVGACYDWTIKEYYSVSVGGFFLAKELGLQNKGLGLEEHHEIQYLQIPATLKLYTSEIDLDLHAYAELGFSLAFKVSDRVTTLTPGKQYVIDNLRVWEVGALLGGGCEYHISLTTSLFAGLCYQPALSSIVLDINSDASHPKLYGYTDIITLDIGLRIDA